jgi:sigma-B regulation protein RsbU (phosphoserine phosphatase)
MPPTSLTANLTRAALLLAMTLLALPAPAQSPNAHTPTDATALGQRIELPDTWLFSPTDNPANASPTLDDSTWASISTSQPLTAYGFRYYRYAWYRTHIHLRPDTRSISLETNSLQGRFQVFANGVRIGTYGDLADHTVTGQYTLLSFPIPNTVLAQANGSLVLALRFSAAAAGNGGLGTAVPMDARSSMALAAQADVASDAAFSFAVDYSLEILIALLALIVGIVALVLFLSIRSQREYLPLAVFLILPSVSLLITALASHYVPVPHGIDTWIILFLNGSTAVFLLEFVRLVLAIPRRRLLVLLECSLLLTPFMAPLVYNGHFPQIPGFLLFFIPRLTILVLLPTLLIRFWKRNSDARLLLPAILLTGISQYFSFGWWIGYILHITPRTPPALALHIGTYTLSLSQIGDILFAGGMLFFILLRTVRISRSRANLSAEIAAAATVQQLLLDRSSHPTPGFLVQSVFLPASSLGGDFFLVTTHPFDDSLIAVIGDVSGKGLTAAMRVAMILGVLNRETSHHPGDILAYLNDAILTQGELGFTTALCIRLFLNGDFILANAGHIPPYIANSQSISADAISREFPTPPALPLGIAPGEVYHLEKGHLAPNERIVLMSDGVPEARSHSGELYGFDRLQHLTLLPAHDIAAAAQSFGQEDDITVLTLTLAP